MGRIQRMVATILLCLLLLIPLTVSAGAATLAESENHIDSIDYCMRAHDVTMTLSEYQSYGSPEEIHQAILRDAGLNIMLQASRETYGGGYEVDYSALQGAVSTAGYPVTVTFPTITAGVDSRFSFRVYVTEGASSGGSDEVITHKIIINYLDQSTGGVLKDPYQSGAMSNGRSFNVTQQAYTAIPNYEVHHVEGNLKGFITSDVTINVYYRKIQKVTVPSVTQPEESGSSSSSGTQPPENPDINETPEPQKPVTDPIIQVPVQPVIPSTQTPTPAPVTPPQKEETENVGEEPPPEEETPAAPDQTTPEETPLQEEFPPEKTEENETVNTGLLTAGESLPEKGLSITAPEAAALTVGTAAAAILAAGIVSDLKVLSWYEKIKRRKLGMKK